MKVFNHSGQAGVRMVIIINVAGRVVLNFSTSSTKYLCKGTIQWRRILAGVGLRPCMHVLSVEVMRF